MEKSYWGSHLLRQPVRAMVVVVWMGEETAIRHARVLTTYLYPTHVLRPCRRRCARCSPRGSARQDGEDRALIDIDVSGSKSSSSIYIFCFCVNHVSGREGFSSMHHIVHIFCVCVNHVSSRKCLSYRQCIAFCVTRMQAGDTAVPEVIIERRLKVSTARGRGRCGAWVAPWGKKRGGIKSGTPAPRLLKAGGRVGNNWTNDAHPPSTAHNHTTPHRNSCKTTWSGSGPRRKRLWSAPSPTPFETAPPPAPVFGTCGRVAARVRRRPGPAACCSPWGPRAAGMYVGGRMDDRGVCEAKALSSHHFSHPPTHKKKKKKKKKQSIRRRSHTSWTCSRRTASR